MKAPLDGMKILDFSYLLPGPYATMILSDLGAEIIKIENPKNPDMTRYLPPIIDDVSVVYSQLNRGKQSLSLNMKNPLSTDIVHKLVRSHDIVIEQFRPGVMKRFNCDYDALKTINPSIIYCSLTGYGQSGIYSLRAGHDINYLALSGLSSMTGCSKGVPSLLGIQLADIAGGAHQAAIGILAAYIKRINTGSGDYIDISITDGVFALTSFISSAIMNSNKTHEHGENLLDGGTLYDYYKTADNQFLSVGPLENKFFSAFCKTVGHPELIAQGFGSASVKKMVSTILGSKSIGEWIEIFSETDACVEKVKDISQAISEPPLSERKMTFQIRTEKGNNIQQIANPIKFNSGNYNNIRTGVSLGYDNRLILSKLSFSNDEIDYLTESGVLGN